MNSKNIDKIIQENIERFLMNEDFATRWRNAKSGFNQGRQFQKNGMLYGERNGAYIAQYFVDLNTQYLQSYCNYFYPYNGDNQYLVSLISSLKQFEEAIQELISVLQQNDTMTEGIGNRLSGMVHGFMNGKYNDYNNYDDFNTRRYASQFQEYLEYVNECGSKLYQYCENIIKQFSSNQNLSQIVEAVKGLISVIEYAQEGVAQFTFKQEDNIGRQWRNLKRQFTQDTDYDEDGYEEDDEDYEDDDKDYEDDDNEEMPQPQLNNYNDDIPFEVTVAQGSEEDKPYQPIQSKQQGNWKDRLKHGAQGFWQDVKNAFNEE